MSKGVWVWQEAREGVGCLGNLQRKFFLENFIITSSLNLLHIYDQELKVRQVSMSLCFPIAMFTGRGARALDETWISPRLAFCWAKVKNKEWYIWALRLSARSWISNSKEKQVSLTPSWKPKDRNLSIRSHRILSVCVSTVLGFEGS